MPTRTAVKELGWALTVRDQYHIPEITHTPNCIPEGLKGDGSIHKSSRAEKRLKEGRDVSRRKWEGLKEQSGCSR
jgi:hypothetical protein